MRRIMSLGVAVLVVLLLGAGVAVATEVPDPPYTSTDECYACHAVGSGFAETATDFTVEAVDYTRCSACHLGMPGLWHYHFGYEAVSTPFGPVACLDCHDDEAAFEFVLPANATAVAGYRAPTEFGYFATSTSLSTSAAQLHAIHSTDGWVETTFGGACSRCHATAACSACHGAGVGHTDHAVVDYPAVTVKQATGVSVSYSPSTCINPACHALASAGTSAFIPDCASCHAVHLDLAGAHTATASQECVDCHETGDVLALHDEPGACGWCHVGAGLPVSTDCGWCHELTPLADRHYPSAAHVAVPSAPGCKNCHLMDLYAEHAKPTVAVGCVACHEGAVDALTSGWDGTCTGCHPAQHQQRGSGGR
jgi:hypothetical protein